MERGGPAKTAVGLQFHAEERVVQAGEVVVVDAGIDKGGGQSNLSQHPLLSQHSLSSYLLSRTCVADPRVAYLTNVVLHHELDAPQR